MYGRVGRSLHAYCQEQEQARGNANKKGSEGLCRVNGAESLPRREDGCTRGSADGVPIVMVKMDALANKVVEDRGVDVRTVMKANV